MLSFEIPGNILLQVQKHEDLFDLIYQYGTKDISVIINSSIRTLLDSRTHRNKKSIDEQLCLLKIMAECFKCMEVTPIMILIKEN